MKKAFKEADFAGKTALILASWFGSGLAPVAPGTFGTLAGAPLVLLMSCLGSIQALLFLLVFIALAVWSAEATRKMLARNDPSLVVVDEVAGYLLTLAPVSRNAANLLLGFLLFRLFDTWKPWPVRLIDRHVKGGLGTMLDDLAAGAIAGGLLFLIDRAGLVGLLAGYVSTRF